METKAVHITDERRASATKPPVLMEKTQQLIQKLSTLLGEPVISYWNSTKGSICSNDVVGLTPCCATPASSTASPCSSSPTAALARPRCAW